jgi:putative acetyltransferase
MRGSSTLPEDAARDPKRCLISVTIELHEHAIAHAARVLRERGATPAQTKVGVHLALGKPKPIIADELGVQLTSVADHTKKLYQTLDVHNSTELATKIWLGQKQNEWRQNLRRAEKPARLRFPAYAVKISQSTHLHDTPQSLVMKRRGLANLARHSSQTAGLRLRVRADVDCASLAELWAASWREAMPDVDFAARRPWFLDHLRALEADGAITICAFDGLNRLLGFVTVDPATAYLDQLAVAPEAKGTGAAKLLLNEARRLSPNGLVLDVNQDNARALAFYASEGFAKTAEGVNPRSGFKTWRLRWPGNA